MKLKHDERNSLIKHMKEIKTKELVSFSSEQFYAIALELYEPFANYLLLKQPEHSDYGLTLASAALYYDRESMWKRWNPKQWPLFCQSKPEIPERQSLYETQ